MINLESASLYDAWVDINNHFITAPTDDAMVMPGRDFSIAKYHVTMNANSLWLPEQWPPFFTERRMKTLENRYINPALWDEGVTRLRENKKKATGTYPNSFLVMFHRRETNERKVPKGGGCLISLNFTWYKKQWHLHVLSRASEITARLLSDMYFVRRCVDRVIEEGEVRKWDPENIGVTWTLLLPSQMKYLIPLFFLHVYDEQTVRKFFIENEPQTDWQRIVMEHFWDVVIWPDKIKWMQRRRWSEKFLQATDTNWQAEYQRLKKKGMI